VTPSPPSSPLELTALVLTFNEVANIERTINALTWVPRILVIDSGSTDGTLEILARFTNVTVIPRRFDSFANQCNFGLDQISHGWVLSLDADYVVSHALQNEIQQRLSSPIDAAVSGFSIRFRYCIAGRPLRGTLYPARTSLYRAGLGRYQNDGHGHRLQIDGTVLPLKHPLLHDDRKSLDRWLASQDGYLRSEANKLLTTPSGQLALADRLRKHTPLAPLAALVVCLVLKGGIFDGRFGLFYASQRLYAEVLLLLRLQEQRIAGDQGRFAP
jgi:glycosyltransferase involved in cell wall biosynthesis